MVPKSDGFSHEGPWDSAVAYVKGVGSRRAVLFERLQIKSVGDLLYHFPRKYEDRRLMKTIGASAEGEKVCVLGRVLGYEELRPRKGLIILKGLLQDQSGLLFYGIWFNQPYVKKQLLEGSELLLVGKISHTKGGVQLQVEEFELNSKEPLHGGRLTPLYALTGQLSQKIIRVAVQGALLQWAQVWRDFMPAFLMEKYALPHLNKALQDVHFPRTMEDCRQARRRFVFEELFLQQLLVGLRRQTMIHKQKKHVYGTQGNWEESFLKSLPFSLTPGQQKAWVEISEDMNSPVPMYRLLQGDVGAGKTVVCGLALLKAASNGLQAAVMAPTEILAEQHHQTLEKFFAHKNVKIALLTGNMKRKERQRLLEALQFGEIQVVVGTHALLQDDVIFQNLSLAIIDEQHRFGVKQRALLQSKGDNPDVLVMTATPIPRTLSLTLYGDLTISAITDMPPGRKPVQTHWCKHKEWSEVWAHVNQQVRQGKQAYVVCPLVEESEKLDLASVVTFYEKVAENELASCRVSLLHGRMKPEEKDGIIKQFQQKKIDVLISTTVVEVGVDIPNATIMVIMDAHRFGLAQLHQLRGRVGRSSEQSFCYLFSDARGDEVAARLHAMCETSNGFLLAEKDLELRGPGEFWGTKQSGLPNYRIANPFRHVRALELARKEAQNLLHRDPTLSQFNHTLLCLELKRRFGPLIFSNIG